MSALGQRLGKLFRLSHTSYVLLCIGMLMLAAICKEPRWDRNDVFVSDRGGYYMYLPSAFLLHDLGDGTWVTQARVASRPDIDPQWDFVKLPNGKTVFKFPMGMSVAYSPYFFLAKTAYQVQGRTGTTGYERAYQYMISLGCMLYVLLGLLLLGRELRHFFADHVAALTLLVLALGSNLFSYATHEALMAHGTLFLLNTLLLIFTRRWYERGRLADAVALGLTGGLMVLVRPSEVLLLTVPVLYGLTSWAAVGERLQLWLRRWQHCLLIGALILGVGGMQFVFWKLVGGMWVVPFYAGETFHFNDPHVLEGLFSFQKGWLLYSPLMALAIVGTLWVRRWAPAVFPVLLILFPVFVYVTFCWWNWQYGGSYGGRAMISIYPVLSFGLAAFWQRFIGQTTRLGVAPVLLGTLTLALLLLSLTQNYQFSRGIIDCCYETKEMYLSRFGQLSW
ncbi:hypothetical protein [Hymenobacter chitinivorans]|uniref:Dolichyl-phosphate-mannose-protein mannosyltransferase n=1 Tax=Hymenobacter chitinivorans DSM 11115 TaxID=1121954 RepID=A0A2M9AS08_9BACT|nr:hypothetical protein [Hymenobacter chitinivorans]PJJ48486.1 hypothetical protein CLV45_4194 [Hymenobacter chitinivorans DSM 11115]